MNTVAVLGGGISGLSTAYYLSRLTPLKVLLIEGKERVGGWIQSQRVKDDILFEAGPRSLRPEGANGAILLEMLQHLKLQDDILSVPTSDPAVKHRYIYYKDKINTLPSGPVSLLNRPPIFKSVILAGMLEPFRTSRFKNGEPKDGVEDESVYSFMKRRFNQHTATNLMGAACHGIYAGDAKQLSVQSTFRMLYEAEKQYGSVVVGLLRGAGNTTTFRERGMAVRARDSDPEWFGKMEKMSMLGLKDGLETIPKKLEAWLAASPNVEIIKNDAVTSLEFKDKETKIKTNQSEYHAEHIISALPSYCLEKILPTKLPHLSHNPVSDVAVINVAYGDDVKFGYDGFGFLTPHRDTKYPIPVPGTLGVIFDSNAMPGQERQPVTKLTAMLGGCDWKDTFNAPIGQLDPQVAYEKTLEVMSKFLQMDAEPIAHMIHLQQKCIPQYVVGHDARMRELHQAISNTYGHKMSVTGASYMGVSVPDCIKNSRLLVEDLMVSGALGSQQKVVTGLDKVNDLNDSHRISKGNTDVILNTK